MPGSQDIMPASTRLGMQAQLNIPRHSFLLTSRQRRHNVYLPPYVNVATTFMGGRSGHNEPTLAALSAINVLYCLPHILYLLYV